MLRQKFKINSTSSQDQKLDLDLLQSIDIIDFSLYQFKMFKMISLSIREIAQIKNIFKKE
jgi:hypothetical protein